MESNNCSNDSSSSEDELQIYIEELVRIRQEFESIKK